MKLLRIILLICGCAALFGNPAVALDPRLEIAQYKLTRWGIDEGAPRSVTSLAQGRDGYLWIGSATGLYRFDGISFELIPPPVQKGPPRGVSALLAARNGEIWVGYRTGGIAVLRRGVLQSVPVDSRQPVLSLVQTPSGKIWAALARNQKQLAVYGGGKWTSVGSDWGLPEGQPWLIFAARNGTLWASVRNDVYFLPRGSRTFERATSSLSPSALSEDLAGNIWTSNADGSRAIADRSGRLLMPEPTVYPTPTTKRKKLAIFDRDGNLWGLGDSGIFRAKVPRAGGGVSRLAAAAAVTQFQPRSGLSFAKVATIMEDREGNIWLGTGTDLTRLRPTNVVAEPTLTKTAKWGDPLLGASDGTVYVGEADGVYHIPPGGMPTLFLRGEEPQALCEGHDGTIWIVFQDRVVGIRAGRKTMLPGPGKTDMGISDCAVDGAGRLWLTALLDGMFRRTGDRWQKLLVPPARNGLPPSSIIWTRRHGLITSFSNGGLGRISPDGQLHLLVDRHSSLGQIRTIYDAGDYLLLGGAEGIGQLKNGRLRVLLASQYHALILTSGIVQTSTGETWLRTAAGIIRLSNADLDQAFADPTHVPSFVIRDFRDGIGGIPSSEAVRAAVRGGDGRLWFEAVGGILWVDPARQAHNDLAPPVSISALKAGAVTYTNPANLNLAPGTSNITINFAALSLAIPERVKVRYQLQGEDAGWIDPGLRRQAFYTNLRPGNYVFRVVASNNDGVWNRTGATLRFSIAPTFLQSNWFVALCVFGAGLLLWWFYKLRLGRVMARMHTRLEERERIARDLHDTLLQGFQGLILRFQSIANEIPDHVQARGLLDQALDSADEVLEEGRNSVAQLRREGAPDLAQTLMDTAERMRTDYPIAFEMTVEGAPRDLHPVVSAELRRIGDEAVINAFQHSRAQIIEIVISYHGSALLMGVRDDGIGIATDISAGHGRQGHFGLVGMRERAELIRADFKLDSRADSGTELQVRVPARIAYNKGRRGALNRIICRAWSNRSSAQ